MPDLRTAKAGAQTRRDHGSPGKWLMVTTCYYYGLLFVAVVLAEKDVGGKIDAQHIWSDLSDADKNDSRNFPIKRSWFDTALQIPAFVCLTIPAIWRSFRSIAYPPLCAVGTHRDRVPRAALRP